MCRLWRRLRLGLLQGEVPTLNSYLTSTGHSATIILSSDTGVWLTVAQLAETGGTAAAGDGGPAPAGLFLPQSGAGHRHPLGAGDTAGQAWDAAPAAAAGHCYLSRARLLVSGWINLAFFLLVLFVCPGVHSQSLLPPIDDFFTLGPYEVLLLRGQDAQRVLLTCPGLAVDDVRTLVHIDCTLGKRAGHFIQSIAK